MKAQSIFGYIKTNQEKIKDPGDLICCMPKEYRDNFVVAFNSSSGQNSNYLSPRILFFNSLAPSQRASHDGYPLQSIISVSGGDPSLQQANSVELMQVENAHPVFFDIDMSDSHHSFLSGVNPSLCMSCHGDGEKAPKSGAKAIFYPTSEWTPFTNGTVTCNSVEDQLSDSVMAATRKAILENPRFRCLDRDIITKVLPEDPFAPTVNLLPDLDAQLARIDSKRVAREMKDTPDYDKFKFALFGMSLCPAIEDKQAKPSEWLPKETMAQIDDKNFLSAPVRTSTDLMQTYRSQIQLQADEADRSNKVLQRAQALVERGQKTDVLFNEKAGNCIRGSLLKNRKALIAEKLTNQDLYNRFVIDSNLRVHREAPEFSPVVRYLFEGRGLDASNWSMDPTPRSYRRFNVTQVLDQLVELEPPASRLRGLAAELRANGRIGSSPRTKNDPNIKILQSVCQYLRQYSMDALTGGEVEKAKSGAISK